MKKPYTPQCLNALHWYAEREPVGWFDRSAPSHSMRSALERRGLIERLPSKPGGELQLAMFKLTLAGRAALAGAQR